VLYANFCFRCHGVNAISDGSVPDLRHLPQAWYDNFDKVVLAGTMEQAGMPRFNDVLDKRSAHVLKAYIIERANEDKEERDRPRWWRAIITRVYDYLAELVRWSMHRE
jgi:mono/diheme cytochrome c family protein